jgi:2-hydroxychromene-2-carboxylate isomerase
MKRLELWFDFSCPYAYLALSQAEALAQRTGAQLELRPMLLGGVFRARDVPQKLFATMGVAKTRHNLADMKRWARLFDVSPDLQIPPEHPMRTVEALRCVLAVGEPFGPLVHRIFAAYWNEGLDIRSDEGLSALLRAEGHDPATVLAKARTPEIKAELRARTDEAIARGVFGAPAMFVDGDLYWGQDRLQFVEEALGGTPECLAPSQESLQYSVDFYFDYSSPFAYLASTRVQKVLGDRATWRPMLLGAVFKRVEMANVPFFTMSDAKRDYLSQDIQRQAAQAQVTFQWPEKFPMNTVLPLRVTLLAGGHDNPSCRLLIHGLFDAYWSQGLDISDPKVVARLADQAGLDGAGLVAQAAQPIAKTALKDTTQAAIDAGVFGAPTFVVRPPEGPPSLFWGADRLDMAAAAASGDERLR